VLAVTRHRDITKYISKEDHLLSFKVICVVNEKRVVSSLVHIKRVLRRLERIRCLLVTQVVEVEVIDGCCDHVFALEALAAAEDSALRQPFFKIMHLDLLVEEGEKFGFRALLHLQILSDLLRLQLNLFNL